MQSSDISKTKLSKSEISKTNLPKNKLPKNKFFRIKAYTQAIQQRQILQLMGIKVWASRTSPTQQIDATSFHTHASTTRQKTDKTTAIKAPSTSTENLDSSNFDNVADSNQANSNLTIDDVVSNHIPDNHIAAKLVSATKGSSANPETAGIMPLEFPSLQDTDVVPAPINRQTLNSQSVAEQRSSINHNANGDKTIDAFHLIGARYKAWVLLVDTNAFATPAVAKLWDNMVASLALTTHDISFPFFNQIQDEATANACLSGFIYSIAKRQDTQVAMLSAIPDGLYDERIVKVPHLEEMLADCQLKKQLWELIR